jgi:hypothetical protein
LRERWCFLAENTTSASRRGHVLSFVQLDRSRPIVGLIAYESDDPARAHALIREDFARLGATVRRIARWQPWSYFPHFASHDLADGAIQRLEALQGRRSTWHASTLLSFELTECAAAYGVELAGRIAASLGRGEPATVVSAPTDGFGAFRRAVEAERARVLAWLQDVVREELGTRPPADVPMNELGVDSLRAAVIHQRVSEGAGVDLPPDALFGSTLTALAAQLVARVVEPEPTRGAAGADAATEDLLRELHA